MHEKDLAGLTSLRCPLAWPTAGCPSAAAAAPQLLVLELPTPTPTPQPRTCGPPTAATSTFMLPETPLADGGRHPPLKKLVLMFQSQMMMMMMIKNPDKVLK